MTTKQEQSEKGTASSEFNISEKVKKYEKFINENLKKDLEKVHAKFTLALG